MCHTHGLTPAADTDNNLDNSRSGNGCQFASPFALLLLQVSEFVGPDWRGVAGMLVMVFFIVGEFALAAAALAVRLLGWRGLLATTAAPLVGVLLCCAVTPESPKCARTLMMGID
jgi:hypothetical protein